MELKEGISELSLIILSLQYPFNGIERRYNSGLIDIFNIHLSNPFNGIERPCDRGGGVKYEWRNPFNGIESGSCRGSAAGHDRVRPNPFNGIERLIIMLKLSNVAAYVRIRSMELKGQEAD